MNFSFDPNISPPPQHKANLKGTGRYDRTERIFDLHLLMYVVKLFCGFDKRERKHKESFAKKYIFKITGGDVEELSVFIIFIFSVSEIFELPSTNRLWVEATARRRSSSTKICLMSLRVSLSCPLKSR